MGATYLNWNMNKNEQNWMVNYEALKTSRGHNPW